MLGTMARDVQDLNTAVATPRYCRLAKWRVHSERLRFGEARQCVCA